MRENWSFGESWQSCVVAIASSKLLGLQRHDTHLEQLADIFHFALVLRFFMGN